MHPSFKHLQNWFLMEKVIHFKKGSNKIATEWSLGFITLDGKQFAEGSTNN